VAQKYVVTTLLDQLRQRLTDRVQGRCEVPFLPVPLCPPATASEVAAAEATLGFPLPLLLKRIHTEISNGGFGPGYGLFGVPYASGGHARRLLVEKRSGCTGLNYDFPDWWLGERFAEIRSVVGEYRCWSRQFATSWPRALLPFIYCGCTVYECVDCSAAPYPVFGFDGEQLFTKRAGDAGDMPPELTALSGGLEMRLEQWLRGEKLW